MTVKLAEGFEPVVLAEGFEPATAVDQPDSSPVPEGWKPFYDYAKSGKYIPDEDRTGFVLGSIEQMGIDVGGVDTSGATEEIFTGQKTLNFGQKLVRGAIGAIPIPGAPLAAAALGQTVLGSNKKVPRGWGEISKSAFGREMTVEEAEKELMGRMAKIYDETPLQAFDRQDPITKGELARTDENQRRKSSRKTTGDMGTNEPRLNMPGVDYSRFGKEQQDIPSGDVEQTAQAIEAKRQELFLKSSGDIFRLAQSVLTRKEEMIGQAMINGARDGGEDGITDVVNAHADELLNMDDETIGYMKAYVISQIPEEQRNFFQRILPSATAQISNRFRNTAYSARELGIDMFGLSSDADRIGKQVETGFRGVELFDEDGAVLPEHADKLRSIIRNEVQANRIEGGLDKASQQKIEDYYFNNFGRVISPAIRQAKLDRLRYGAKALSAPQYNDLGFVKETALSAIGTTVDMAALAVIQRVPVVGIPFVMGTTYGSFQGDLEQRLMYEHDMPLSQARMTSALAAVPYAMSEYSQAFTLGKSPSLLPFIGEKNASRIFLHEFSNYARRAMWPELREEYWQAGINYAAMETARVFADSKGITFDDNVKRAVQDAVQATLIMPFVTIAGGGAVSTSKAIGTGSMRQFLPEELQRASQDIKSPVSVYAAAQQARRKVKLMDEQGVRPGQYPKKLTEAVRLMEQGAVSGEQGVENPEADEAELMETLRTEGYEDPAKALDGIRLQIQHEDAVQELTKAKVDHYRSQLDAELSQGDTTDVSVGPKMGRIQSATETYAARLGITTEPYATFDDFVEAHPEIKNDPRWPEIKKNPEMLKAVNLDGKKIAVIEENITDANDGLTQWWHEVGGHRGLDINPKAQRFLDGVKSELGMDFIKSQLPAFYHNQSDNELVGEYLSRLVGRAGQGGELGATDQEKGVWKRFKEWAGSDLGLDLPETVAARSVARTAKDILTFAKQFDVRYPDGMSVKLERKTFTRTGGQWLNEKGRAVKDAVLVETIQKAADESAKKTEERQLKSAKIEAEKRIQQMADADLVIKMVLENGKVEMPVMKPGQPLPDEYAAVPKRFRAAKGLGMPLDQLADQVAALSGQTADYSTDQLRAALEQFDSKAESLLQQAADGRIQTSAHEEQVLIDQLSRGEISQSEFDQAMAEVSGARFLVAPDLKANIEAALNSDSDGKTVQRTRKVIEFSNTPALLRFLGMPDARIISEVGNVRKMNLVHHLSVDDIAELPNHYEIPVAVFKDGQNYILLTDELAANKAGINKPVMVFLEPAGEKRGENNYIASAYSREIDKEVAYAQWAETSGMMLYFDNERAALLPLEEATLLRIKTSSQSGSFETPESYASRKHNNDTPEGGKSQDVRSVAPPADSEAFKKWFGDSKVVDADGNPLVVYHGTRVDFNEFDSSGHPNEEVPGAHFSKQARVASLYADGAGATVMPVYLKIENPASREDVDLIRRETRLFGEKLRERLVSMGFDGVVDDTLMKEIIVFSPTQIKSATGNAGTYDGNNPDIRFSMEQQEDPMRATAVHIAYRIFTGDFQVKRVAKGKNKGQMVARTDDEQLADISKLLESQGLSKSKVAAQEVLDDARAVAQSAIQRKQSLKSNQSVSKFIRDEATRQWFNRQVETIYREGQSGGKIAAAAEAEVRYQQEKASQTMLRTRPGLGAEELREYNLDTRHLLDKLELEEKKRDFKPREQRMTDDEFEQMVDSGKMPDMGVDGNASGSYRAEVDDFLFRVKTAVVRKLTKEGVLAQNKDLLKAMRSPVAVAEYRKTLQNVLGNTAAELTYGFRRDVIERKIMALDDAKLMSTLDNKAGMLLQQMFDARDFETLDTQVSKVLELTQKFGGRLKYRLQETSQAVQVRALKMFRMIRGGDGKSGVLLMEPDAVQAEMEQLRNAFDDPQKYAPEGSDVEAWTQDAVDRYNMMDRFGAFKYKTAAERADAVGWLESRIETELKEQEERRAARKAEAEKILSALQKALPRRKTAGHGVRSIAEKFADSNSQVLFLEQRMMEIPMYGKDADRKAALKMMEKLAFDIAAANFHKNNKVAEDNRAFGEALQRIYGGRFAENELKALMEPLEAFQKFSLDGMRLSRSHVLQMLGMLAQNDIRSRAQTVAEIEAKLKAEHGGDLSGLWKTTKPEEVAQALWQSPDEFIKYRTAAGMELNSYELLQAVRGVADGSKLARRLAMEPEMLQALREVNPQDFELLDWFRDYYRNNRMALSAVNKEVTGFVIQPPDAFYIPSKVDYRAGAIRSVNIAMPVVPPSLTPRVFNTKDLDESADIVSIYMRRLESNEQFVHFAKLHQRIAGIFNDGELTQAIELTHGKRFADQLGVHLRDVLSNQPITGGKLEIIDSLTNFFAVTRLGWNVSLFPKQLTSLPAFAMYVNAGDFAKYVSTAFTDEGRAAMKEIWDSPHAKTRLRTGQTQVDRDMLSGLNETGMTVWEAYKRWGRYPTMAGDIVPTLIFGQGYYREMLADASRQGMRTEEGKEWAMDQLFRLVEMSQQSGSLINMAEWQRHGGSAGRAIGQFLSTPSQFWAKQTFDWREWRAAIEAEGKGSDRASEARAQFLKTSLINHVLLAGLYTGVNILWKAALGDPPDKKDWMQMIESMAIGPWSGVLVVGSIQEGIVHGLLTGESSFGGGDIIPISGLAGDAQTLAAAANALATGDFETMWKDLDRILAGMAPPYRDVRKAVKNYSE